MVNARFLIEGIEEMQIRYVEQIDYPNIRDDIAIKLFGGKVCFDLGSAAQEPQSIDDIRQSDIYFIGNQISFAEELCDAN